MPRRTDTTGPAWRERLRSKPPIRWAYRAAVFVAGLLCIALGVALMALPGPLTIPPVLLGLWIWSTEFAFAARLFDSFKAKAREAWARAKASPVRSGAVTIGGIAAAIVAVWAASHYGLIDRARDSVL